jgi:hypothetical protein
MSIGRLVAIVAGFFVLLLLAAGALGSRTGSPVAAALTQTGSAALTGSASPTVAPNPGQAAPGGPVDPAAASQIALDRVGGGTVTKVERDDDYGPAVWEVEVIQGVTEQDVRLDGTTGAVLGVYADTEGPEGPEAPDSEVGDN